MSRVPGSSALLTPILDAIAPVRCRLCRMPSDTTLPLCFVCREQLLANGCACPRCGLPAPPGVLRRAMCPQCLQSPPPLSRTVAPFIYEEGIAFLINRWKYHGENAIGRCLARCWLDATAPRDVVALPGSSGPGCSSPGAPHAARKPDTRAVDGLVAVPLHWTRFLRRGFNQSADLAAEISGAMGIPVLHRALRRPRASSPQARASRVQRLDSRKRTFELRREVAGLRLAIVDDVCTTGATAEAAALPLLAGGAREVQLWCLARTPAPGQH